MKLLDWMIRLVRVRVAEIDRIESARRDNPETVIREVYTIGGVPSLAGGFIRH